MMIESSSRQLTERVIAQTGVVHGGVYHVDPSPPFESCEFWIHVTVICEITGIDWFW